MKQRRTIAAFDFDETLIRRDTLFDFLRVSFPPGTVLRNTVRFLPTALRYITGSINNDEGKARLLSFYFKGVAQDDLAKLCEAYAQRLEGLSNLEALKRVRWHQDQGHHVLIISASAEDWISPWATLHGITEVIATKLEVKDATLTGALATPNCHGPEKVRRLLQAHPDRDKYELYVYGDGKSDQEILAAADYPFLGRFS